MVSPEVWIRLLVALVSATLGGLVFASGRRSAPHQFFAGFLLLVAGNQAADVLRALALPSSAAELFWFRVSTAFASLDPLFLYYAASLHPTRNALNRPVAVGAMLTTAAAFALGAGTASLTVADDAGRYLYQLGLAVYTALAYTAVLASGARRLARSHDSATKVHRFLYLGACALAIPAWSRIFRTLAVPETILAAPGTEPLLNAATLVPPLLALALVAAWARFLPGGDRATLLQGAALGASLALLTDVVRYYELATAALGLPQDPLAGRALLAVTIAALSLRILAFDLLLSFAVLRHKMLDLSLAMRVRGARVVVGLLVLTAAGTGLAVAEVAGLTPGGASLFELLLVGVLLIASQGFRTLVDAVGNVAYGLPRQGNPAVAMETYRLAAVQAVSDGRRPAEDPGLAKLREDLGLDERTTGVLDRMAASIDHGPLVPGRLVGGRYRVVSLLARGGAGRVFLADDELLTRKVVLKEVLHEGEGAATIVLKEARAAGSIQHPNIVTVYDVIERASSFLIVTEYLAGGSLEARLDNGPLEPEEAVSILDGVLSGLVAVHARGIVHRDLKPGNILLAEDGTPKVADFGLARVQHGATGAYERASLVEGTPAFMAPEQRDGFPATTASDIYAAGLIMKQCYERLPPPLDAVMRRATAAMPEDRWPSAEAMQKALRDAMARDHRTADLSAGT